MLFSKGTNVIFNKKRNLILIKCNKKRNLTLILVILCVVILGLFTGCEKSPTAEESSDGTVENAETGAERNKQVSADVFAMDTYMEITAYGRHGQEAVDAAVEEIKRLDDLLSTGNGASEVSQINQNGGGVLSEDTSVLLKRSMDIYKSTEGAYDITVYPLMKLWGFTTQQFAVPDKDALKEALELVGSDTLSLNEDGKEQRLILEKEGAAIDFGGIAKGYASDRVMELYKEYGVSSGLVSLGGNVSALGLKPDGTKWRIAIRDPEDENGYLGILSIENKAVITSGGYERYFEEEGVTYHHILDPSTGYPANNGLVSVTIVSEDGTLADALSTSLYVMGTEKAIDYCEEHAQADGFDVILYTEDGILYATAGITADLESEIEILEIVTSEN